MTKQEQSPAQTAEQQVHSNLEAIRGLQPSGVYEAFARFCDHGVKIGQEAPVREMLASWAAAYDFPTVADGSGNMAIHVPARSRSSSNSIWTWSASPQVTTSTQIRSDYFET